MPRHITVCDPIWYPKAGIIITSYHVPVRHWPTDFNFLICRCKFINFSNESCFDFHGLIQLSIDKISKYVQNGERYLRSKVIFSCINICCKDVSFISFLTVFALGLLQMTSNEVPSSGSLSWWLFNVQMTAGVFLCFIFCPFLFRFRQKIDARWWNPFTKLIKYDPQKQKRRRRRRKRKKKKKKKNINLWQNNSNTAKSHHQNSSVYLYV